MKTVEQLLADWQAGTISAEELAQLKDALGKPAGRSELLQEWQLDQAIYETLRAEQAAESTASAPAPNREAVRRSASRGLPGSRRRLFPWLVWREVRISWRLPGAIAATACVLAGGLTLYFQQASVGRLGTVPSGTRVEHDGRTSAAVAGQTIYPQDTLRVPPETAGPATVMLGADVTRLELAGGAELRFLNAWRGKRVALRAGELRATVSPQSHWRPMVVFTPQAEARVVGTQFSISVTGEVTRLSVLEGAVRLKRTIQDAVQSLAEVLVRAGQVAVAAPQTKLEVASLTGFLSSDTWLASPDTTLTDAPSFNAATGKVSLESGAPGQKTANNISANLMPVERLRGYLVAPATGEYTFWIASLDGRSPAELWLSADEKTSGKKRLASVGSAEAAAISAPPVRPRGLDFRAAMEREWRRSPTQRSAPVNLVQGRRYYVEIWHRGSGIDSLALGWTLPTAPSGTPVPVDINSLCPFVPEVSGKAGNP